jgi:murein L,D-transpeptidase YafK
MAVRPLAAAGLIAVTLGLGACQDGLINGASTRHLTPVPAQTLSLMQTKGMSQSDPILVRAYKKESELEVWKRDGTGQYALLKTFPICRWSGQLGPKTKQGDRQAPEGFYTITPGQMNPNSAYYLSFDTGYPNAFDRANGRTGNYIMVHGTCSSAGCFAMTDASMAEIYAIAREAFAGGQRAFQFQSYPFRMTAQNMARFRNDPNAPFWSNLKEGADYFEALRQEPKVGLCGSKYVFGGADAAAGSCSPRVDPLVAEKRQRDEHQIAELVAKGAPATRVVYQDGGQNPVFRSQNVTAFASLGSKEEELPYSAKEFGRHHLGEVSRPEALAAAPEEVEAEIRAGGKAGLKKQPTLLAAAPIPTKAAAAALAQQDARPAAPLMLAKQADAPTAEAVREGAREAAKPARVTVADADGDLSAFRKVFGGLAGKDGPEPAPATPAVEAATVEPAKQVHAARARIQAHVTKPATDAASAGAHEARKAAGPKLAEARKATEKTGEAGTGAKADKPR